MTAPERYGAVAVVLHWTIAAAILANLGLGWWMHRAIDVVLRVGSRVEEPVASVQHSRALRRLGGRCQSLIDGSRRESQVKAVPLPRGDRRERVEDDPLDFLCKGRLEIRERGHGHADPRRDDRLVRTAFGREADPGRRGGHDEARARVERMVEGIEAARNERIV